MKITTPYQRQKLIPFHLKIIRLLISISLERKKRFNKSLDKIEKFSYALLEYPKNISFSKVNTKYLIQKLTRECKEIDGFDHNEKSPFFYVRKVRHSKALNIGYDFNLIEFCNIESVISQIIKAEYENIKKVVKLVCEKLEKQKQKKLNIKFVKLYHYNSVEHPRPLHFDSFNDDSYKLFFFLDNVKNNNGPYCIIPFSHKKKYLNKMMQLYNRSKLNKIWLDINDGSFYKAEDAIQFKKMKKNNFIVTKQNAIHGDIPAKKNFTKTALVFHILPN